MARRRKYAEAHVISVRREKAEVPVLKAEAAQAGYGDEGLAQYLSDLIDAARAANLQPKRPHRQDVIPGAPELLSA